MYTDISTLDDVPPMLDGCVAFKILPDGRVAAVKRLMFHYTLLVGLDEQGYADRWCIANEQLALDSLDKWDGTDEPLWWHKHPSTSRCRDLNTNDQWISGDLAPAYSDGSGWPHNFILPEPSTPTL